VALFLAFICTAPAVANDLCQRANDGECDDPTVDGHITSACAPGTDSHDCAPIAMEPPESMEEDRLSDACPPGTIIVDGSCVDEDLLIEEDVPDEK